MKDSEQDVIDLILNGKQDDYILGMKKEPEDDELNPLDNFCSTIEEIEEYCPAIFSLYKKGVLILRDKHTNPLNEPITFRMATPIEIAGVRIKDES